MEKKKIKLLQRMMAVLLSMVLAVGMTAGAVAKAEDTETADAGYEVRYSTDSGNTWKEAKLIDAIWDSNVVNGENVQIELLKDITLIGKSGGNWADYQQMIGTEDGSKWTIDGKGHTITRGAGCKALFVTEGSGTVTMKDITIDGGAQWSGDDLATRTNSGIKLSGNAALVWVDNGGTLILESGVTLQNSDLGSSCYGAAVTVGGTGNNDGKGNLIIKEGAVLKDNRANEGGAIYVLNDTSELTIEGGTIENNQANIAGGILSVGTVTMTGGKINNNYAETGGGVFSSGSLTMSGGEICGNKASGNSGGVYCSGSFKMKNSKIENNEAPTDKGVGGGVYVASTATLEMEDSIIKNNKAAHGGGVYDNGTFTAKNSKIENNEASKDIGGGGGVYISPTATLQMEDSAVENNKSASGGGVYNNGSFTAKNSKINGNEINLKQGYGGGVFNAKTFKMSGGEICNNKARLGGGIIVYNNSNNDTACATVTDGKVSDNEITGTMGGGLLVFNGSLNLSGNPVIIENKDGKEAANNVYLNSNRIISISDALTEGAEIGVTTAAKPGLGIPVAVTGKNNTDYSQYFYCDSEEYRIINNDIGNVIQLVPAAAKPIANPAAGTYTEDQQVTLSTATEEAKIYYTTDGTEPSKENGVEYTEAIPVAGTEGKSVQTTIKAIAIKDGMQDSGVLEAVYTIAIPVEIKRIIAAGNGNGNWLSGASWNPAAIENKMTETSENVYEITYKNVPKGKDYQVKFAANDSWDLNWGGTFTASGTVTPAVMPEVCGTTAGSITFDVDAEAADVTLKLDLTGYDDITKEGAKVTVTLNALHTHSYGSEWKSDGTNHWHECSCGAESEKAAHSFGTWTVTKGGGNSKERKCNVCGYKETVAIPSVTTHTHSFGSEWKSDGTNHWHGCSCGAESEKEAHSFSEWTVTKQATEGEEGAKERKCSICGYTETEVIPKTDGNPSDSGKVETDKEQGENTPDTDFKTSKDDLIKAVLLPEEQSLLEAGTDVKITLVTDNIDASVNQSDKQAVIDKADEYEVGQYLDINLYKIVGENRTKVSQTNEKIKIILVVPDSLKNTDSGKTRDFAVMRVHNGVAELLEDTDNDEATITIETDQFSTYAILYKESNSSISSTPTPMPTSTPTLTSTPIPTLTPTSTSTPTPTPIPTLTPTSTLTPTPEMPSKKKKAKNGLKLNAGLKVSQPGSDIKVSWGKVSGADGYDVYVQYCGKKFTKKSVIVIKGGKTTKVTVRKINGKRLNLKKNYKIYVVAYKLEDGKKITLGKTIVTHIVGKKNMKYTNVKALKVKKNSYCLKKGKTVQIKARTVLVNPGKKQLSDAHAKEFRYAATDKKVATVSKKGKIKAVGKGTCTVYIYARNGYAKKIKVTVK